MAPSAKLWQLFALAQSGADQNGEGMNWARLARSQLTLWWLLALGLLAALTANLPGHLSNDSVAQLYEGRLHVRETWGPAAYAWLLGVFDAVLPGTALYVTASTLLFFGSLFGLAKLGRTSSPWLLAFTGALIATPQVLIYQGIVWKDVAFANTAMAGCVCLAHALEAWPRRRTRMAWLCAAAILFSMCDLVRQNGLLLTICACVALGWSVARSGWWRGVIWGVGGLTAIALLTHVLSILAVPAPEPKEGALEQGVRIVQNYDVVGAKALDPTYRLDVIARSNPGAAATIERLASQDWTAQRVDRIDADPVLHPTLFSLDHSTLAAQWMDLLRRRPLLYLRVRLEVFRWIFMTPEIERCLPVYVGIDAPAEKMRALDLEHRYSDADARLNDYDGLWASTLFHRHWTYAAVALLVGGLLLRRRTPSDLAIAALQFGALGFTASFAVIGIACDYRYLYALDLAALCGVFYLLASGPGFSQRRLFARSEGAPDSKARP